MTTNQIAEGDRIYATEMIDYYDFQIDAGTEGIVLRISGGDDAEFLIEWDSRVQGMANGSSIALIFPANSRPMEDPYVIFPTEVS